MRTDRNQFVVRNQTTLLRVFRNRGVRHFVIKNVKNAFLNK